MNSTKVLKARVLSFIFSQTAKSSFLLMIGNVLYSFLILLFTIFLFRYLSISEFGIFSALVSFMLFASEFSEAGVASSLPRFLKDKKIRKEALDFLKGAFVVQLIIAFLVFILTIIFSRELSKIILQTAAYYRFFILISGGIFGFIMYNFIQQLFSAREQFKNMALLTVLSALVRFLAIVFLFFIGMFTLENVVFIQSFGFLIVFIVGISISGLSFIRSKVQKQHLKKLFIFSLPLGVAKGLTSVSGRLDVMMLTALANSFDAGLYAGAYRIISFFLIINGSFITVLAPKVSAINKKKKYIKYLIRIIVATILIIMSIGVVYVFSYQILFILYGEKGVSSLSILRILLVASGFFIASIPAVVTALYYLKIPAILTINSILQLIIVVVGNLYLIPIFGSLGPAISLIIAYGLSFVLTTILSSYYLANAKA